MGDFIKEKNNTNNFIKKFIPYKEILTSYGYNQVVLLKNSSLLSVFRVNFEDDKMDNRKSRERSENLAKFFSSYDRNFSFYFDIFHSKIKNNNREELNIDEFPLAKEIVEKREQFFYEDNVFFENNIYFAIQYKSQFKLNSTDANAVISREFVEDFTQHLETIISKFKAYDCKLSLLRDKELLAYLFNNCLAEEKYSQQYESSLPLSSSIANEMDMYLTTTPFILNDEVVQVVNIKDLPIKTTADYFSSFQNFPFPFRVVLKIDCFNSQQTKKAIGQKRAEHSKALFSISALFKKSNQKEVDETEINLESLYGKKGCEEALIKNIETGLTISKISFFLILKASNEDSLELYKKQLNDFFNQREVRIIYQEELNALAYFSSIVGAKTDNEFQQTYFNDVVADLLATNGTDNYQVSQQLKTLVKSENPYLTTLCYTGALRYFSFFGQYGNFGHTFILGETGSGKSVLLNLLANSWLKFENTRLIYIDEGLSCLKTITKNNGKLHIPTKDKTSFAPVFNAKERKGQVVHFFEAISDVNNYILTSQDRSNIDYIISRLEKDGDLSIFYNYYIGRYGKDSTFSQILTQYVTMFDNIFLAKEDNLDESNRVLGIELEPLLNLNSKALTLPALIYLLDRLDESFDAFKPTLLILDEAWAYLKNDFFRDYINKWLKQARKKNVIVVIATQQIDDLLSSDIKNTILENCYTNIFLSNHKASNPETRKCYESLGFEPFEIETLSQIPKYWCCMKSKETFTVLNFMADVTMEELSVSPNEKREYLNSL